MPLQDHMLNEAWHWHVRLQDDPVATSERQAFMRWLQVNPAHRLAWHKVTALSAQLDQDLAAVAPVLKQLHPLPLLAVTPTRQARGSRRQLLRMAAALGVVMAGGGAALLKNLDWFADYRSGMAERRQIRLPDRSLVEIGSETAFSFDFSNLERRIDLFHGDAFFTVAADAARPFTVRAGGGAITALGTQFSLRVRDEVVDLAVREHAVAVALPGQPIQHVSAGQGLRFERGRIGAVTAVDLAAAEAWRNDLMAFTDAPLQEVVREIERYRRGRILITDQALADLQVSGLFRTDSTDAPLQTIASTLPVRVDYLTEFLVLLQPVS